VKLPFLEESKWPASKESEEITVNPSYDTQIQEGLVDEMLHAFEAKDVKGFAQSLKALIQSIKDEGHSDDA
jgi:hypothetical protein